MEKISFIGAYDKTDLIIYIAKILTLMNKKVLIIDASINQRAKYVVPVIKASRTYITEFENIDVAVGFKNIKDIKNYLAIDDDLNYDYILFDIDSEESYKNYELDDSDKKYFVTSFDLYSLKKGIEILASINNEITLTKVYFSKNYLKEEDEYVNFLSNDYQIKWNKDIIYFPFEMGDQTVIFENQRVSKIKFKKLTKQYKDGLMYIAEDILNGENVMNLNKVFKQLEKGI